MFCNGLLIELLSRLAWCFDTYVMFLVSYFGPRPPYKVTKRKRKGKNVELTWTWFPCKTKAAAFFLGQLVWRSCSGSKPMHWTAGLTQSVHTHPMSREWTCYSQMCIGSSWSGWSDLNPCILCQKERKKKRSYFNSSWFICLNICYFLRKAF